MDVAIFAAIKCAYKMKMKRMKRERKKSRTPASKMEKIMCAALTSQQMGFDEPLAKKATWRAIVCDAFSMVANASKKDGRRAMTADEIDSAHTHTEHS